MGKHRLRESIKSLFGSHIDPDKEEQLQGTKTEIEDKVKRILKLIKDDNLEEDGTPAELSKKEPLVELIEDFHNQYQSLYAQYDHLTGMLRKKVNGKREKESSSSSSDSDSDYSSRDKDSKNGQVENEFHKTIDGLKQELEMARMEVADLNLKLTSTHEEKEDLNSKYLAALSKIQEADKINMDLKTNAEALGIQRSKLLVENDELKQQLDITGEIEAELSQKLEDLKTEKDSLTVEKETALQQIDEEKKITDGLRTMVDQRKDEKLALAEELKAVTGELSILKQQLEHAEQQVTNISHDLKATEEENESLTIQIRNLELEMSTIKNQKNEDEEQIKANSHEISHLREGKLELQDKIAELEKISAERDSEFSVLQDQLKKVGEEGSAQIAAFTAQIKANSHEISHLKEEKLELQDKIAELEKRLAERDSEFFVLHDQLNKVEEEGSAQIAAFTDQINNLQHDLVSLQNEKQELAQQCESLKLEVDSICSQKSEVEEQTKAKDHENSELREEILGLQGKITALEKTLAEKEVEFSNLQEKLHEKENEASEQIIAFTAQVNNLQEELFSLQKTKEELELHCEKVREGHAESLVAIENEKNELASRSVEHLRTLEEREDAYQKLNEEYKQLDNWFNECKVNLEVAEKKIEEMEEEFHKGSESKDKLVANLEHTVEELKRDLEEKGYEISTLLEKVRMLEVKLRLSNQKLRVTEQLLTEKEESFTKAEEKFHQEQRALEDRIATLSAVISANNEAFQEIISNIKESVNSVMTGIETVGLKFSDDCKNYETSISNISHELQVAKIHVSEMNKEKEELKNDTQHLLEQLKDKNEQELALREVVEKLEAKSSKEELEKTNLAARVVQLKKTVGELEKTMKEKDDGMLNLGEEKREAIRQLCLWIDHHRERYDYLKDILSKTRRGQRAA